MLLEVQDEVRLPFGCAPRHTMTPVRLFFPLLFAPRFEVGAGEGRCREWQWARPQNRRWDKRE